MTENSTLIRAGEAAASPVRSSDQSETHFDSDIWGTQARDHIAGAVIELIDDPSRIADLLRAASCAGRSLRVQAGCDAIVATPAAVGDSGVMWRLAPHHDTLPDTVRGILDGYISCYELTLTDVRPGPEGFVSAMPASLRRTRRRCEPRARCAAAPIARWGRDEEAPILSVSNGGLAIHVVGGDPPAACDFAFAHRGESVRLRALRRWQEPVADGMLAGYRVRPAAADATRWRAMVADELHPGTSTARTAAADVWSLYEESGYLRLSGKQPGEFGPVAEAVDHARARLGDVADVGCQVIWKTPGSLPFATLHLQQAYAHTWMSFQLAKRRGGAPDGTPGRAVLRELHLRAYEHATLDPQLRWLVGYVQDSCSWSGMVHHGFPARHQLGGEAACLPLHAYEIAAGRPVAAEGHAVTMSADSAIVNDALRRIRNVRPRAYVEALDLTPDRFDLSAVAARWEPLGLWRRREAIVAYDQNEPVAIALVEGASDGLHLFGLFDLVRLWPLAPGGTRTYPMLLEAARRWYRDRGKQRCVLFLEDSGAREIAPLGLRDLGPAKTCVFSSGLVAEFLDFVDEATALRGR
jgi:hypothetical protein